MVVEVQLLVGGERLAAAVGVDVGGRTIGDGTRMMDGLSLGAAGVGFGGRHCFVGRWPAVEPGSPPTSGQWRRWRCCPQLRLALIERWSRRPGGRDPRSTCADAGCAVTSNTVVPGPAQGTQVWISEPSRHSWLLAQATFSGRPLPSAKHAATAPSFVGNR